MLKNSFVALLLAAAIPASADVQISWGSSSSPLPSEQVESQKLGSEMAKVQPQLDDTVNRWLNAALEAQAAPPVQPAKTGQSQPKPGEDKCRMVPENRGYSTMGTGSSSAEALANAKGRVPPNCSATGKTLCDRYADMDWNGKNKDFLVAFKKHMREPRWRHSCNAYYTCANHQKKVCDGPARLGAKASKQ